MENSGNGRLLDKSNYSRKTIETFEIIAAYYIDLYYNHLYLEAKKLKVDGSVKSITEGYKHVLNILLQAMENAVSFKKSLKALRSFYDKVGFTGITIVDCIDKITREFIPEDYYENLSNKQQMSLLKQVLNQANKKIIEKIITTYLNAIIDNHNDVDNIRILQDEFIDILILEREGIYLRFISVKTQTNKKMPHVNNMMLDSMKNELKQLYKEKYDLMNKSTAYKKIIISKDTINKDLVEQNKILKNMVLELQNELQSYQKRGQRQDNILNVKSHMRNNTQGLKQDVLVQNIPQRQTEPINTVIHQELDDHQDDHQDNHQDKDQDQELDDHQDEQDFLEDDDLLNTSKISREDEFIEVEGKTLDDIIHDIQENELNDSHISNTDDSKFNSLFITDEVNDWY